MKIFIIWPILRFILQTVYRRWVNTVCGSAGSLKQLKRHRKLLILTLIRYYAPIRAISKQLMKVHMVEKNNGGFCSNL